MSPSHHSPGPPLTPSPSSHPHISPSGLEPRPLEPRPLCLWRKIQTTSDHSTFAVGPPHTLTPSHPHTPPDLLLDERLLAALTSALEGLQLVAMTSVATVIDDSLIILLQVVECGSERGNDCQAPPTR